MARTAAKLADGTRITDHISLGVIAKTFPREKVEACLKASDAQTKRHRGMPNHVVVYYAIALGLFMRVSCKETLRILLEGLYWLRDEVVSVKPTGRSGISQARLRVGEAPVKRLHDELVKPIAVKTTRGAWFGRWRLVALDGSTLEMPDTAANAEAFGRPKNGKGEGAFPLARFVSLVEVGTRVLFGSRLGSFSTGELTLTREVLPFVKPDMLLLADRLFYSYGLWREALKTGAALVWRVQARLALPCEKRLDDGSYLSRLRPAKDKRAEQGDPIVVRVIEYTLGAVEGDEEVYRLITNILDPAEAPAEALAALYPQRWGIETALDELKTHLRGARVVLRSKRPELVRQEFYGLMMAHFAIRGLMHEAALKADLDPDRISYTHTAQVIRRRLPTFGALPPSGTGSVSPGSARRDPSRPRQAPSRPQQSAGNQTTGKQMAEKEKEKEL